MKIFLPTLTFLIFFLANVAFAGTVIDCPYPSTKKIDGLLDDWDVNSFTHIPHDKGPLPGKNDNEISCDFATAADDNYLYVAAIIKADKLFYGKTNDHTEDSLEIYIDADNSKTKHYDNDDVQIGIPAINIDLSDAQNPTLYGIGGGENIETKAAVVKSENGWIVEAAIPLSNSIWEIKPAAGKRIGFNLQVNGDDKGMGRNREGTVGPLSAK